jgi:hypothetical protein
MNDNVLMKKLYCQFCPDEGAINKEFLIRTLNYQVTDDGEGNEMIALFIYPEGETGETPHYEILLMFHKSKLSGGGTKNMEIKDSWNKSGLDNENSVVAKFMYWNGEVYTSQWSNWGAHIEGESEGYLEITKLDEGEICGSFKFTVYEDGSSSDENRKSIISCSKFHAFVKGK